MQFDSGVVLGIVVVAFALLRFVEYQIGHRLWDSEWGNCADEIRQLRERLDDERDRNQRESERKDRRIQELERRVEWLVDQLRQAGKTVEDHPVLAEVKALSPAKPLLIACGSDMAMCNADRQALRRAGISFQRMYSADRASIDNELRRRRQDGTLYRWLHITAHADESGIALADGVADPAWWSERLDGIEVVFLAACKTATVADALAGLTTVIFVQEDIENRDAADFTYAFWRQMKEHGDPRRAYNQAIQDTPQVAEFTDIRSR